MKLLLTFSAQILKRKFGVLVKKQKIVNFKLFISAIDAIQRVVYLNFEKFQKKKKKLSKMLRLIVVKKKKKT